ncbi:hypothetical protein CsSME_00007138 [Camellia sinensis var. sinensis]
MYVFDVVFVFIGADPILLSTKPRKRSVFDGKGGD